MLLRFLNVLMLLCLLTLRGSTDMLGRRVLNTVRGGGEASGPTGPYTEAVTLHTASNTTRANTGVRGPMQRQTFYAAGRYWVWYVDYDADEGPYDLYYTSSTDAETWATPTQLGTVPRYGIHINVIYDSPYVHIARTLTWVDGSPHNGVEYRRGTPQSDGTIDWSAGWQTVLSTDNYVGDHSMCVGTDGAVWIGYQSGQTSLGEATVIKNANTDGTWSTASGFPVELTNENDEWHAIVSPLANGGVHVVAHRYGVNDFAQGFYSADGGSTFTDEGDITPTAVEANTGTSALVMRIGADSHDGVVHIVYETWEHEIIYLRRNADDTYEGEVVLASDSYTTDYLSSPRVSFDAFGNPVVMWSKDADEIYGIKHNGSAWGTLTQLINESLISDYEHAMPARYSNVDYLPMIYLAGGYAIKFKLIDVSGL